MNQHNVATIYAYKYMAWLTDILFTFLAVTFTWSVIVCVFPSLMLQLLRLGVRSLLAKCIMPVFCQIYMVKFYAGGYFASIY